MSVGFQIISPALAARPLPLPTTRSPRRLNNSLSSVPSCPPAPATNEVFTSDGVDLRQWEQEFAAALKVSRFALNHAGFEVPGEHDQEARVAGAAFRLGDDRE